MLTSLHRLARPILRPARRFIRDRVDSKILEGAGLIPIAEPRDDDVFLVGYPKSGNTWLQNLMSGIVFGVDPRHAPYALVADLVPDVHRKRYYKRYTAPMFFKSHRLPRPECRRVVYLVRDGRDSMVSYFRTLTDLEQKTVDFLSLVQTGRGLFPCKWHQHVEAWLANPYGASMIVIRYENLKASPVTELQRVCAFAGLERESTRLEEAIEHASFLNMRQKEERKAGLRPQAGKFFTRRGRIGSHRDEMPADVLDAFMAQSRDALRRCGYLDNPMSAVEV